MSGETVQLYRCVPRDWLWLPKTLRVLLGWAYLLFFSLSFFSVMFALLLLVPAVWRTAPLAAGAFALSLVVSMLLPAREWRWFRTLGQLWYEIFDFSTNVSPAEAASRLDFSMKQQLILAMHPHGIVPFQALLWAAYADQYFSDTQRVLVDENDTVYTDESTAQQGKKTLREKTVLREMYGFGAVADIVMYLPFLRNIMGYLSGGSASYKTLLRGLRDGKVPSVRGRVPRNLYILPGGIAEIFTSTPGKHKIVFNGRRGLCKLSVETGAQLVPCYVFGGTDFFHNLATSNGVLTKLCRKLRIGVTVFWGRLGLPIPFTPKVTMVLGEPIPIPVIDGDDENKSKAVEALHTQFLKAMQELFDKHKAAAGHADAQLEVL